MFAMTEDMPPTAREERARRLSETLRRQLGTTLCGLMQTPDVVELMLNADGRVWVDRLGTGMAPVCTMAAATAESLIATVASTIRGTVTRDNPILECELPLGPPFHGARFEAVIPPNVSPGPVFTIRRKASAVFKLAEYERQGIMTAGQRRAIERGVRERRNILVVGGTGTGKTTLTNAILAYMAEVATAHRLVIIEDTSEIQCEAENAVILRATDSVTMLRLLKTTLRLRPDRIIVGEVRGGEALALLKAWNTGHPGGVCTVHANTHANAARAGLTRIEQLIQEASTSPMRDLIAEAVDLIVAIAKADNEPGRLVQEVVAISGLADGAYQLSNAE
jgi:type IV secretion system protein VirB11